MRFTLKTAFIAAGLAATAPLAAEPVTEAGRSTNVKGETARSEASETSGHTRHETPMRMGHPDGPVENQLNKGRPGANGR